MATLRELLEANTRLTEQVAQLLGHAPDWPALVDADLQVFNQAVAQLQALHARIEAGQGT